MKALNPLNHRLASLLSWVTFPIYAALGIWVRGRSLRLSPAPGPRSGQFGIGAAAMRILTIGDSSAAAVGIEHTSGAMAPQIAEKLHTRTGKPVSWHISGHNSATAANIRDIIVPNLAPASYTHIFVMLGTNDIKNFHTGKRWCKEFGGLLYALRTRFPEAKIYWHQAIDMQKVPALPKFLATMMNWRRVIINGRGAQLCVERGAVVVPPVENITSAGFCRDGFHASDAGYNEWSVHMVEHFDFEPRTTPAAAPFV